jgi:hypothetical protein
MDDACLLYCPTCSKPENACICTEAMIMADEILCLLRQMGARLCDAEFFARHIAPLVAAYGHDAVDRALKRHHRQIRSAASSQIRVLRQHAARLKRSSEGLRR